MTLIAQSRYGRIITALKACGGEAPASAICEATGLTRGQVTGAITWNKSGAGQTVEASRDSNNKNLFYKLSGWCST